MPGLYSLIVTEADGNTITAAKRNAEHTNHITNQTPQMTDDYSSNAAQMQTQTDGGESGTESLATSLAGELERIRFAIKEAKGTTYWYETAATSLARSVEAGLLYNTKLSLASGALKLISMSGSDFSATDFGYVTVPKTDFTQMVSLKVTASPSLQDDAHATASHLTNVGFGITETANWAEDVPFFLYVVNRGNADVTGVDGASAFAIARRPGLAGTPSTNTDIGDTAAPAATDGQNQVMLLGTYTEANYVSLPMQMIGWFRMQWDTSAGHDDWTIQAFGSQDGLGESQLQKLESAIFTFPMGQNGAVAGKYLTANGGTAPQFSDNYYRYKISLNGRIEIIVWCADDGGANGAGAVGMTLAIPLKPNSSYYADAGFRCGYGYVSTAAADERAVTVYETGDAASNSVLGFTPATVIQTALQNNLGVFQYVDFVGGEAWRISITAAYYV